ncbi:MAG: tyrosine-type recombinase/integrase [Polyangiaceae bacterium]|nr:tyrosine-type recombinase/integrase [Polyangiaceae bacterium]
MTSSALLAADKPATLNLSPGLADDVLRAAEHAQHARADNTRRSYARAWEQWNAYAHEHGACALPASPLVVAAYLAHLDKEGLGTSTMDIALAAIVDRHRAARLPLPTNDPVVRDVRAGIRARRGIRPQGKAALGAYELHEMIDALPPDLSGLRDRALLLVGFGAALRRSELVALHVAHVAWHARGIVVLVARSKGDQEGRGVEVPIHAAPGPLCPVAALRAWLDAARIIDGPIFRSVSRWGRVGLDALASRHVAEVVKRAAKRVGLDPRVLAGHSLRAGFATTAASVGAHMAEISRVTRHNSDGMLRRYIRAGTMFDRDPLRGVLAR